MERSSARSVVVTLLLILTLLLPSIPSMAQEGDAGWPSEPEMMKLILLQDPTSFYWPNETVRGVFTVDNSIVLVTLNTDTRTFYVRRIGWDMGLAWEYSAQKIIGVFHDSDLNGENVIIVCRIYNNRLVVSILDFDSGTVVGEFDGSTALGVDGSYVDECFYDNTSNYLVVKVFEAFYGLDVTAPVNTWSHEFDYDDDFDARMVGGRLVFVYDKYYDDLHKYVYKVSLLDPANGSVVEHVFFKASRGWGWYYAWISPYSPHIILAPDSGDNIEILIYNYSSNTSITTGPLPEEELKVSDSDDIVWDPTGRYVALYGMAPRGGPGGSLGSTILVVSLEDGTIVYRNWSNYYFCHSITTPTRWSPDGVELVYSTPSLYGACNVYIYNVRDNTTMLLGVYTEGYKLAWDLNDNLFYIAAPSDVHGKVVFVFNRSDYRFLGKGYASGYPYSLNRLILLRDTSTGTVHVYWLDSVRYDERHGYWDRVFLYHLEPYELREVLRFNASTRHDERYYILLMPVPEGLPGWRNVSGSETFNYPDASFTIKYTLNMTVTRVAVYEYYMGDWSLSTPYGIIIFASITVERTGNVTGKYRVILNITNPESRGTYSTLVDGSLPLEGVSTFEGRGYVQVRFYFAPYLQTNRTAYPLVFRAPAPIEALNDPSAILASTNIVVNVERIGGEEGGGVQTSPPPQTSEPGGGQTTTPPQEHTGTGPSSPPLQPSGAEEGEEGGGGRLLIIPAAIIILVLAIIVFYKFR